MCMCVTDLGVSDPVVCGTLSVVLLVWGAYVVEEAEERERERERGGGGGGGKFKRVIKQM